MPPKKKKQTGPSERINVRLHDPLFEAVAKKMKQQRIETMSEAAKIAFALWVGQPDLADGRGRGRPPLDDE